MSLPRSFYPTLSALSPLGRSLLRFLLMMRYNRRNVPPLSLAWLLWRLFEATGLRDCRRSRLTLRLLKSVNFAHPSRCQLKMWTRWYTVKRATPTALYRWNTRPRCSHSHITPS